MADIQVAPLRSLGDFLLESARFQIPTIKDPEKWANRVLNNLLYYQTNYFLSAIIVFLLIGIIHPVKMVCGFGAISITFGVFVYCTNSQFTARRFKRDHPLIMILIHASLRMRSMKNKITNKMEYVGLKRTPMGIILEGLGQEQEAGS
ncbi:hypothetical protein KUTeg_020506 [Tegillarca granosa]|uniref:PRA1 family protein n=1 Tax=Tegillarca granosa TaxID=220873 RepID=A0ABQ9E832_TEGGR|nr:hypothetical protein KUTeg_020506 [Tegillarca granosa]